MLLFADLFFALRCKVVREVVISYLATFAGALEVNSDLKSLRLAHNDIGDDGVRVRVYVKLPKTSDTKCASSQSHVHLCFPALAGIRKLSPYSVACIWHSLAPAAGCKFGTDA